MKPPLAGKSQVKQGEKRSPYHEVRHEELRAARQQSEAIGVTDIRYTLGGPNVRKAQFAGYSASVASSGQQSRAPRQKSIKFQIGFDGVTSLRGNSDNRRTVGEPTPTFNFKPIDKTD